MTSPNTQLWHSASVLSCVTRLNRFNLKGGSAVDLRAARRGYLRQRASDRDGAGGEAGRGREFVGRGRCTFIATSAAGALLKDEAGEP